MICGFRWPPSNFFCCEIVREYSSNNNPSSGGLSHSLSRASSLFFQDVIKIERTFFCLRNKASATTFFKLPMVTCLPMLLKAAYDFLLHFLKRKESFVWNFLNIIFLTTPSCSLTSAALSNQANNPPLHGRGI